MKKIFIRRYMMIKGKFAKLILEGKKTTTIRLGRVIPKVDEVIIHSEGKPIAKVKIRNVVYKKVKELTEEDAKRDGYSSLEELIKDLMNMYNTDIKPDDEVTIIDFIITKKFDNIDIKDAYLGFSPYTIALLANRYLKSIVNDEERKIINYMLKYRSIRFVSLKLYGSLSKRWMVRKILRNLLVKLIEADVIKVGEETLEKLAMTSSFWRKYLEERRAKHNKVRDVVETQ